MWKWVKIAKLVALLGFVLPWMTVSCSDNRLVSATGFGLTFGHLTSEMQKSPVPSDSHANPWLIIALIAIAIGLVLAFRGLAMARAVVATYVAALALIWIGTSRYSKAALFAEASKRGTPGLDEAMGIIQIDWRFGFWLTSAALVAAGVTAWLAFSGRGSEVLSRTSDNSRVDDGR